MQEKKLREFGNIGNLVKEARKAKGISQADLSKALGYKNGQFVSNIERGLCSIPYKRIHTLSKVLDLNPLTIKDTIVLDVSQTIDSYVERIKLPTDTKTAAATHTHTPHKQTAKKQSSVHGV